MSVRQPINKPSSSPSSAMEEEMPSVVAPELSTIQPEQSTIQPEVPAAKWTPAIAPEGNLSWAFMKQTVLFDFIIFSSQGASHNISCRIDTGLDLMDLSISSPALKLFE